MAETRVNGLGQVVEFNPATQRWVPVKEDSSSEPDESAVEQPVPTDEETVVDEGETTPRRARKGSK